MRGRGRMRMRWSEGFVEWWELRFHGHGTVKAFEARDGWFFQGSGMGSSRTWDGWLVRLFMDDLFDFVWPS